MKMILKIIVVLVVLYLVSVISLYVLQEKFIFRGEKLDLNYKYNFKQSFEEINLKTIDNGSINALLFKVNDPKGVVLYFHGNKGSLERWGNIVKDFTKYGYDIFVMDYRTYGKSVGNLDEVFMYKDAELCYDYLKKTYHEDEIVVYGRSLGATFATKVAATRNPKQLILEAPFCSLMNVVTYHYPLLTFDFLLKYKFESDRLIGKVNFNTTIFHGTEDRVIPINSSKILVENSNIDHTNYITIEQATHHNIGTFDIYKSTMSKLLR